MDLGISGKRALVMGGSCGLGFAIGQELSREGSKVSICARDPARTERAAAKINAIPIIADLSTPGMAREVVAKTILAHAGLDILVVNTGGPPATNFEVSTEQDWRSAFEGLCMSAVSAIQAALPAMCKGGWGRILVVTSIAAKEPIPQLVLSNSLRAGLHGLVNSVSREYASRGVTVNALMPGYTLTERLLEVGIDEREISKQIPAGRLGVTEEFAALAAFLASSRASYITGQAIACDGGLLHSI
jgi:3-oxoacyl-[acyl-carrier protein] reductase